MADFENSRCKLKLFIIVSEQFFNDARENLIKELVDFNSREDFDKFMSNVENTYFESVVPVAKSPYQHLPHGHVPMYPPRPFPHL